MRTHNLTQAEYKEKYGEVASDEYKSIISVKSKGNKYAVGIHTSVETIEKRRQKMLGHVCSEETRQKISVARSGWQPSDETRQRMSEGSKRHVSNSKGKKFSAETRLKMSLADKGKPKSEKFKQNLRDYYAKPENKEKHSQEMIEYYKTHEHKGKEVLFEYAELRRQGVVPSGALGKKHTDEWKQQMSIFMTDEDNRRWNDAAFAHKVLSANGKHPNKQELKLQNVLNITCPNMWQYVGDGQIIIGRKNPDFILKSDNTCLIELYGDYWHKNDDPQERIDFFAKYGCKTLVIWENELMNIEILKDKIMSFMLEVKQ